MADAIGRWTAADVAGRMSPEARKSWVEAKMVAIFISCTGQTIAVNCCSDY